MKRCSVCKVEKDLNDFYKIKHTTDGRQSHCKECTKAKNRERYAKRKLKSKPKSKPKCQSDNYINNKEFFYEIVVSKARGNLTRKATDMIILLGERFYRKFYYADPQDREDTLQQAMLVTFEQWMGFDEERFDNAFSYYTEVIKRGHTMGWRHLTHLKGTSDTYKPVQYRFSQFDNEKGESHGMFI